MNKLCIRGNLWLAADMHLGPAGPKTAHAFYNFLQQAQQHADALILCGDIFNVWIGTDAALEPPTWLAQAIYHFRKTAEQIPVYFMRGNRDFLLDQQFAHYVGAQLIDDQMIIQTDHHHFVLTHGDELCTDDVAYIKYRQRVHNPRLQAFFLKLPLKWRQVIANGLRNKSKKKHHYTPAIISDVNENSCVQLLMSNDQQLLVHGHTHRPALHQMTNASGQHFSRYVLPDWEYDHSIPARSGWLEFQTDGQVAFHRLGQPTLRFRLKTMH